MAAIRHVLQLYSQLYSTAVSAYMHALGLCNCVRILHRLLLPQFYVTVASDLTRPAGAARKVRFRVFIYRSSRNWFFSHVFVREIGCRQLAGRRQAGPRAALGADPALVTAAPPCSE
jgi:hypothetical protein